MAKSRIEYLLSADELDDLIMLPPGTIQMYVDAGIHPPWIWRESMSQPRWGRSEFSAWLRILYDVDLDGNGTPLTDPHEAFADREAKIDSAA